MTRALTPEFVREAFPRCVDPTRWAAALTTAWARYPEFNDKGMACVLAKANTEAAGLTRWDEDLFYTTETQVIRVHGKRAGKNPRSLLRNPVALGNQVYAAWGGFPARGLGLIQITGLRNHQLFARDHDMTVTQAREWMLTPEGAAMTPFWYFRVFGCWDDANRGDMEEVLRVVAGKRSRAELHAIWRVIHGDKQMADYERYLGMLQRLPA